MKILFIVLGVIILLVLCVLVIGSLLPKQHVASRKASYRATPAQLYALIAGPQDWRSDVTGYKSVPAGGGREMVRETTRGGETITYEILDRVPPTSIKRRIATENLPYSGTWTFIVRPQGDITVVQITENGEVYNPVFRFISRYLIGHTGTMDAYLRELGKATGQDVVISD